MMKSFGKVVRDVLTLMFYREITEKCAFAQDYFMILKNTKNIKSRI